MENNHDQDSSPYTEEHIEGASRALIPSTQRHDGFTPKRRKKFLKTLRKTGCVADACRVADISDSTAYKTRRRDPEFRALWETALSKAGNDLETLAWKYAVEGVEEEVIAYGKVVGVRRKRDAQLFRMMLQASNPDRYGGQGFGSRKALEKKIRAEIEAEQEPQYDPIELEETRNRIARKLDALYKRHMEKEGIVEDEYGNKVPRGYIPDPDYDFAAAAARPSPPGDEKDASADDNGKDWTDREPPETAFPDVEDQPDSRFSAKNEPRGPRIRSF